MTPVIVTNGDALPIAQANTRREGRRRRCAVRDRTVRRRGIGDSRRARGLGRSRGQRIRRGGSSPRHPRAPGGADRAHRQRPALELELRAHGRSANARSTVALMSLGIRGGDEVVIVGLRAGRRRRNRGDRQAIRQLEHVAPDAAAAAPVAAAPGGTTRNCAASSRVEGSPSARRSICAQRRFRSPKRAAACRRKPPTSIVPATRSARDCHGSRRTAAPTAREIMSAHLELLDDWDLVDAARASIARGKSAGFALAASCARVHETLSASAMRAWPNESMICSISRGKSCSRSMGRRLRASRSRPSGILLARDLHRRSSSTLDASKLAGICAGRRRSHFARGDSRRGARHADARGRGPSDAGRRGGQQGSFSMPSRRHARRSGCAAQLAETCRRSRTRPRIA